MPANLTITKLGTAEMFYYGGAPWHRMGEPIKEPVSSTSPEMRRILGWPVKQAPLTWFNPVTNQNETIEELRVNYRADVGTRLGLVTPSYHLIQNEEGLQLMDDIVGESLAMYHTAGTISGGRKVWALAKLPGSLVVTDDDVIDKYLAMLTGHDGSTGCSIMFTGICIVCDNTFTMADREDTKRRVRIPHLANADIRLAECRRILGIQGRYWDKAETQVRALSKKRINELMLRGYLEAVMPLLSPEQQSDMTARQAENARRVAVQETIAYLFHEGRGNQLPGRKGTAWGVYNAVTDYTDHVAGLTINGKPRANADERACFEDGDALRARAWDEALALL